MLNVIDSNHGGRYSAALFQTSDNKMWSSFSDFFALSKNSDEYKKPMKEFLNDFIASNSTAGDGYLDELRFMFERTSRIILDELGEKPFHIRAGLNKSAFDSVFVAVSRISNGGYENIEMKYRKLIADEEFIECTKTATTDEDTVAKRIRLAVETLT